VLKDSNFKKQQFNAGMAADPIRSAMPALFVI